MAISKDELSLQLIDDDLTDFIDSIHGSVAQIVEKDVAKVLDDLDIFIDRPLAEVAKRLDELTELNRSLEQQLFLVATEQQRPIDDFISLVEGRIGEEIADFNYEANKISLDFQDHSSNLSSNQNTTAAFIIESIENNSQTYINTVVEEFTEVIGDVTNTVKTTIVDSANEWEETYGPQINDMADRVKTLSEQVTAAAKAAPGVVSGALDDPIGTLLGPLLNIFELFSTDSWALASEQLDEFWVQVEADPDLKIITDVLSPDGFIGVAAIGVIGMFAITVAMSTGAAQAYLSGPLELARQTSMEKSQAGLMSPSEVITLVRRAVVDTDSANHIFAKHGFNATETDQMLAIVETLQTENNLLVLWRRDVIQTDELNVRMKALGYPETTSEEFQKLAFAIPPVQDLVTMAAREAFEPEIAERFGQLDGIPADIRRVYDEELAGFGSGVEGSVSAFAHFAEQSGLSKEWITAYWAAHWRDPGLVQMFDMLHRLAPDLVERRADDYEALGIDSAKLPFTIDDLKVALRKQDVLPFFQERLTAISYRTITRVDIRRLHRLKLISDSDLVVRYRELGNSPADANLLAEFAIELNAEPEKDDVEDARKLTRAQIVNFYGDGSIDRAEASAGLVAIRYTSDNAALILDDKDLDIAKKRLDLQIRTINTRFDSRQIDFQEASAAFDTLNIPPIRRDFLLAELEEERLGQIRQPNKNELDKLRESDAIDNGLYARELVRLGTPQEWVNVWLGFWEGDDYRELIQGFQDEGMSPIEARAATAEFVAAQETAAGGNA